MSDDGGKPLKSRSLGAPGSVQTAVPIPPLPTELQPLPPRDVDPWASDDGIPPVEIETSGTAVDAVLTIPPPSVVPPSDAFSSLMQGALELFALNDFTGSLETAEKALEINPRDPTALSVVKRSQESLIKMYESKLGATSRRPRVRVNPAEIMWLNIDHRAGFVLSQVDSFLSYEELIALSGMSRFETVRILAKLIEEGVIEST